MVVRANGQGVPRTPVGLCERPTAAEADRQLETGKNNELQMTRRKGGTGGSRSGEVRPSGMGLGGDRRGKKALPDLSFQMCKGFQ